MNSEFQSLLLESDGILEEAKNSVDHLLDSGNWKLTSKSKQGVEGYLLEGSRDHTIKGRAEVRANFKEVLSFLWNIENSVKWQMLIEESYSIAENENLRVGYNKYRGIWPVKSRDFLVAAKYWEDSQKITMIAKSIVSDVEPERRGAVRGELKVCAFILECTGENTTQVTYVAAMDPKGKIPKFFVREISKRQTSNLEKIKKLVEQ